MNETDVGPGPITPQESARRMQELEQERDVEIRHEQADALLVEIARQHGHGEAAEAFEALHKWYA